MRDESRHCAAGDVETAADTNEVIEVSPAVRGNSEEQIRQVRCKNSFTSILIASG